MDVILRMRVTICFVTVSLKPMSRFVVLSSASRQLTCPSDEKDYDVFLVD